MIPLSRRRQVRESGQSIIEFALVAILLIPILLGTVVTGLSLVRSIQAQNVCRDLTSIYIHGGDFSTSAMQQLAVRLARGLNLQAATFTGNNRSNTANSGDVLVTISQIMYVGTTAQTSCKSVVAPATCVNHDSFVFTQRLKFGNGTLAATSPNSLGDPNPASITDAGLIKNSASDAGAKLPAAGQANMVALWQGNTDGRAPLVDQQICYVVELFVQQPSLVIGSYSAGGVYARYFF